MTERNLDLAFDYIDADSSGALNVSEIREKLGIFYCYLRLKYRVKSIPKAVKII